MRTGRVRQPYSGGNPIAFALCHGHLCQKALDMFVCDYFLTQLVDQKASSYFAPVSRRYTFDLLKLVLISRSKLAQSCRIQYSQAPLSMLLKVYLLFAATVSLFANAASYSPAIFERAKQTHHWHRSGNNQMLLGYRSTTSHRES